jgi:hypothetical protein
MAGYIKGGILAGIILFIWSAISWMFIPWHNATLNGFNNEKAVSEIIVSNAPKSGIYVIPSPKMEMNQTEPNLKPYVFISVNQEGISSSMVKPMVLSLIAEIIAAILVGWMLSKTTNLSYMRRVGFVLLFAIAASIITHGSYWTWFTFDTQYTLVGFGDMIIGWFLAGLVLAKLAYKK